MNKLLVFLACLIFFINSSASTTVIKPPKSSRINAKEIFVPIGKTDKTISLYDLSRINAGDLQNLTGRHLKYFERLSLDLTQKKLRKSINDDGTIESKRLEKFFHKRGGETGFHVGGFALGFLLGLIGVIIAYVINDDFKSNRVKWAWIGWGTFVVIYIIALLASA